MYKISLLVLALGVIYFMSCAPKKTAKNGVSYSDMTMESFMANGAGGYQLIDVRTPGEITNGKIDAAALEIDYKESDFTNKVTKLDRDKKYIVYCKSGGRSARAAQIMIDNGFTNVANLLGGYDQWSSK